MMDSKCSRCGGRVLPDVEHPLDAPVLKCIACGRSPGPPRAIEQPPKREAKEEWGGLRAIDGDAYYERLRRSDRERQARLARKKAGAA
jgi:hypothetical protein